MHNKPGVRALPAKSTSAIAISKVFLIIFFVSLVAFCNGQAVDSAWIAKSYFPQLVKDTGLPIPPLNLVDQKGTKRSLSEFKGKVLCIDVWATWCGNCIENFPRSKKL